jgi:ribosomal protein S18 acetylase RimI-like enzyme
MPEAENERGQTMASNVHQTTQANAHVGIEIADHLSPADLNDLCDATDAAIEAGGGFGWLKIPERAILERYWRGVLAVPERHLLLARVDGAICGATQLTEPTRNNEAQSFSATLIHTFIAPYARNLGAGRRLVETAEKLAVEMGYKVLQLDVRETQEAAINLYESLGYTRWGANPAYAMLGNRMIIGYYYSKTIAPHAANAP